MNKRYLLLGLLSVALAQGAVAAVKADALELVIPTKAGVSPPNAIAEIKVDGASQDGPYDSVTSKTLDYIVAVRGDKPKKAKFGGFFTIALGAGEVEGTVGKDWQYFAISAPYADPQSHVVVNARVSPVQMCNDRLGQVSGQAREAFMKKGVTFAYKDAYGLSGSVRWTIDKGIFDEPKTYYGSAKAPVKITCLALDRPRVRTQTSTQGVDPKPGQKMKPTISEVSFKIEPAQIEKMGKFLCPTQLRLYGRLETIRDFTGKSIFVGPYYLSPITEIQMAKAGNRNMVGTYMMKWHEMGGKAIAPDAEPKKQSLTFKFNVSNKDGKVLESVEKSIQVACARIKTNVPAVDGGMTVAPAN